MTIDTALALLAVLIWCLLVMPHPRALLVFAGLCVLALLFGLGTVFWICIGIAVLFWLAVISFPLKH